MNTLLLNPSYPMTMRPQAPQGRSSFGAGGFQIRRNYHVPFYEFEIKMRFRSRAEAEAWAGFAAYHQGDTPFWFDGGPYGDIKNPVLIGFGTGSQTQFFVTRRNLYASSWVFYVNGVVTAASAINESSGMVTFGSAPAANSVITALGMNRFKCVIWSDDATLHALSDLYLAADGNGLFEEPALKLREVA